MRKFILTMFMILYATSAIAATVVWYTKSEDTSPTLSDKIMTYDGSATRTATISNILALSTAGHADGTNCAAGEYPLGVDGDGAVQSCTDSTTEIDSSIATHVGLADPHTVYMLESNIGTGANNYVQLGATPGTPDGTKYFKDDGTWGVPAGSGHGDGADCSAGSYPLGVNASGAVVNCTDASTEIDSILATHAALPDGHTGYMLESNIGTGASNYLQLSGTPGTPDGTKYLKDDGTWATPAAGHAAVTLAAGVNALTLSTQEIGIDATVEQLADLTPVNNAILGYTGAGALEAKSSLNIDIILEDAAPTITNQITYNATTDAIRIYDGTTVDVWSNDAVHAADGDPHTGYMLESNLGFGANNYLQLTGTPGTPDGTKFLRDDGTWVTPGGSGDMILASVQTVTGKKTFGGAAAVGKFALAGTTSGSTVLDATAVASGVMTLPAGTDTLVALNTNDTLTNKTLTAPTITAPVVTGAGSIKISGEVQALVNVLTKGTAYTLGTDEATEVGGSLVIATAAMVLTLPTAVAGYSGCFASGQGLAAIIQLTPAAGDYLVVDGTRETAATAYASTAALGAKICYVAVSADDWMITSVVGTWSE